MFCLFFKDASDNKFVLNQSNQSKKLILMLKIKPPEKSLAFLSQNKEKRG